MRRPFVEVDFYTVLKITEKAILFCTNAPDFAEQWIPKSALEAPEDFEEGDEEPVAIVAQWFADKEELAYEEVTWR